MTQQFHSCCQPKRNENTHPHRKLGMSSHRSFICHSQNLEATQMSIHWGMDKQNGWGTSLPWNIIQLQKGMKHWYLLWRGWTLETWCKVKWSSHKRPHILWFHLYKMSRGKSIVTEGRSVVAWGWGWGAVWGVRLWQVKSQGFSLNWEQLTMVLVAAVWIC